MVTQLQQLRLREPEMVKKEYRDLMSKVTDKKDNPKKSESDMRMISAIDTKEAFQNAFKSDNIGHNSYKQLDLTSNERTQMESANPLIETPYHLQQRQKAQLNYEYLKEADAYDQVNTDKPIVVNVSSISLNPSQEPAKIKTRLPHQSAQLKAEEPSVNDSGIFMTENAL